MAFEAVGGLLRGLGRSRRSRDSMTPDQVLAEEEQRAERRLRQAVQTERAQTLVKTVEQRLDVARQAKTGYYEQWAQSISFYLGRQWLLWEPTLKTLLRDEDVPSWRRRITDDQITHMVLQWVARQARNKHLTAVPPNNPQDPQDVQAASLGTRVLRHLDEITGRNKKRRRVDLLRAIYGTAVLMPYWDQEARTEVALVDLQSGQPRAREAYIGDQALDVFTVWESFPEPVREWENVRHFTAARFHSLDWIRDTFGEKGALVRQEEDAGDLFALARADHGRAEQTKPQEPGAKVLTHFERPNRHYGEGRWMVVAGGILLYEEERLPHPKHRFPIIPVHGIPNPEGLWGVSIVQLLLELQEELNRVESRQSEDIALMARPKWLIPREAHVDEEALDDEPGEGVEYDALSAGGARPEALAAPGIPAHYAQYPDRLIDRMQRVAGINQITAESGVPAGVKSGIALDILQRQDEVRFALAAEEAADAWVEVDRQMLESVQKRYTVPRFIRTFGDDDQEVLAFLGTDLRGHTEVRLVTQPGIGDDITTKRQRALDYYSAGLLPRDDPQSIADLMRLLEENDLAKLWDAVAQRQAEAAAAAAEAEAAAAAGAGEGDPEELLEQIAAEEEATARGQRGDERQEEAHALRMAQGLQRLAGTGQAA